MRSHVFQVNGEQRRHDKLKDTLGMLKIYTSEIFDKDVRMMESLIRDSISNPKIKKPVEPKVKKGNGGLMEAQEKIYNAKIMAYVKEEKGMEDSLTVLYNI